MSGNRGSELDVVSVHVSHVVPHNTGGCRCGTYIGESVEEVRSVSSVILYLTSSTRPGRA